ncbi:MAG: hemerythrin domain-containing protein [Rhodospirillales bacterium]|nr:hemerythrin domain-containing protein [Rhodospirillales bacterium]
MEFPIPEPLKAEHDELHAELVDATKAGGRVGQAAREVARRLHPHFTREEEFALPPLGLLAPLAKGTVEPAMAGVLTLTDRLETDLPGMLAEHKEIVAAVGDLIAAAKAEKKPKHVRFAEQLILHARTEEEVLYPAALLVGRYVKLRLGK